MTILVLAVGSVSVIALTHVATASQIGKVCVIFACGNASINGGTSGGGGGQPTPKKGTLTVIKKTECASPSCTVTPSFFTIKVTGNNPSDDSFPGDAQGNTITLGLGKYTISESPGNIFFTFSDDCSVNADGITASGDMTADDSQKCTITNRVGS